MNYYALPLRVTDLLEGERLDDEVDLKLAIHQNIRLILRSYTMSYRFDPSFGSLLSKYNAATPPQNRPERAWREKIRNEIQNNLLEMLQRYETRVEVQDVMVNLQTSTASDGSPKTTVQVEVDGRLSIGRKDKFHYPDSEVSEEAQEAFPLMIPMGKS
jgi:phage baseplate assembly protein W